MAAIDNTIADLIGDAATFYPAVSVVQRSIAYILPDVVIEEQTRDDLTITDQPVEEGNAITDHSFKMPAILQMKIGFSNSTGRSEGYSTQQYTRMLQLQATRQPCQVQTGKRTFKSMLVGGVVLVTDQMSEYSANIECQLKEVIIVKRQQTSASTGTTADPSTGTDAGTANTGNNGAGPATAAATDTGTAEPVADNSGDGGRPLTVPVADVSNTYSPAPIGDGGFTTFVQATGADTGNVGGDASTGQVGETPTAGNNNPGGTTLGTINGSSNLTMPTFQQLGDTGQFGVNTFSAGSP